MRTPPPAPADLSDVRPAENSLRWWVRSRTSKKEYLVDMGNYAGNGKCSCPDFEKHFEKFLARGVSPEQAVREGWVKMRPYQMGEDDGLRCWHLCRARSKVSFHLVEKILQTQAAVASGARR